MRIIKPRILFENPEEIDERRVLERLERYGRTCYKSGYKIRPSSAREFIRRVIASGHESVIEHEKVTVRVVCDRGITHEIVRHRIASYSQESTRYCNYARDRFGREISVVSPFFFDCDGRRRSVAVPVGAFLRDGGAVVFAGQQHFDLSEFDVWCLAMAFAEWAYMTLVDDFGRSPQEARSVLPNSLKTEIVITYNLREWRHFLRLRTSPRVHPQMREIAIPLLRAFKQYLPTIFEDIPIPEDADRVSQADWEVRVGESSDA